MALKPAKKTDNSKEKLEKVKQFVEDTRTNEATFLGDTRGKPEAEDLDTEISKAEYAVDLCDKILEMLK